MFITINTLLAQQRIARERLNELKSLRNQVATKTKTFYDQRETVSEQLYDVKTVDKQIIKLEKFLFLSDSLIKQSNAYTQVDLSDEWGNVDMLLAPLE